MRRVSPRVVIGVLTVAVAVALAVFAGVLVDARDSNRDNITGRLQDRASAGATLIGSLFESSSRTTVRTLIQRYGGPRVSEARLRRQTKDEQNAYRLITDARGRVLASSAGQVDDVPTRVPAGTQWFRTALTGKIGASSARTSLVPLTLTFAVAFPSAGGTRVTVWGATPESVSPLLAGTLERLPAVEGGLTYLVDADGSVVATPDAGVPYGQAPRDEGLIDALRSGRSGNLPDDRYFAARDVPGVPWRVVLTAPRSELFESVSGIKAWGPWALFAAFGAAALMAVLLVGRSIRDARLVQDANLRLEQSNAALGERASELSYANRRLEDVNSELAQSNAELERFASIASHDLREPLRKVQMFSERVIHHDGPNLSDRGRDYLQRMDSAAGRMQVLIDSLLEYARAATHMGPLGVVDLETVAREVADDLDGICRETGGRVEIGSLPSVTADPLRMRQLVQNLISNGLRFRRDDVPPVVRLDGRVDGDMVELTVTDNGIGFDERYADRVFDLFERLHARADYPGTGMGLALCRRIVEAHGGTITASSTPGEGSTFTVRLPASPVGDADGHPRRPSEARVVS